MESDGNRAKPCELFRPRKAKGREVKSRFPSTPSYTSSPSSHSPNDRKTILKEQKKRVSDPCDKKIYANIANSPSRQKRFAEYENEKEGVRKKQSPSSLENSSSELFHFPADNDSEVMLLGRFSVDETLLSNRFLQRKSCYSGHDPDYSESDIECRDASSTSNLSESSLRCIRKSGIEVPSRYLLGLQVRSGRCTSRSTTNPSSTDDSPQGRKRFNTRNTVKKTDLLARYGGSSSQWALSPGRAGSSPISVEIKERPTSFSSFRTPINANSSLKSNSVGRVLNAGFELTKSKKCLCTSFSSSPLKSNSWDPETVHQLRLVENRLIQWRFANARTDSMNNRVVNRAEKILIQAQDTLTTTRYRYLRKKIELQKEKLLKKLNTTLNSQIYLLEKWGNMEEQHHSFASMTKECLHSVIYKLPLVNGAKVNNIQSATTALREASHLTGCIMWMLSAFLLPAGETTPLLSELAEVVSQEKLMLEECLELLRRTSEFAHQERSLKCCIIQMNEEEERRREHSVSAE